MGKDNDYSILKMKTSFGGRCVHLIGCVGQRAMAVIMPIKAMIENKLLEMCEDHNAFHITLLYTDTEKVKTTLKICEEWLKINVPAAHIHPLLFAHHYEACEKFFHARDANEKLYFNVNPGMNWEVAFLSLCAPDHTTCIATDNSKLYLWGITQDTQSARSCDLPDMGTDDYCALDPDIRIIEKSRANDSLSQMVQTQLQATSLNRSFVVIFKDEEKNRQAGYLHGHLVWIKEMKGRLYLLVDICRRRAAEPDSNTALRDTYRRIKAIIGVIRYSAVVVTDDPLIRDRANTDGIETIAPEEMTGWIERKAIINPKRIMPESSETAVHNAIQRLNPAQTPAPSGHRERLLQFKERVFNESKPATAVRSLSENVNQQPERTPVGLHICLGDNPVPTMRIILTGAYNPVWLWYDKKSKRIRYLASLIENLCREKYPDMALHLAETDHCGKSISAGLGLVNEKMHVNVTPGTKMQAVSMCAAARQAAKKPVLTSLDKISIVSIAPPSPEIVSCSNLMLGDLLKVQIPPFAAKKEAGVAGDLWLWLQHELAAGNLMPDASIDRLKYRIKNKFSRLFQRCDHGRNFIRLFDKKKFIIENDAAEMHGIWWEYAVAHSIKNALGQETYQQVIWNYPGKESAISELDVVFSYGSYICVVSCKTGWDSVDTFAVAGEAQTRFGRMTLSFLAVPFINKTYGGTIMNDVMILTPEILNDGEKLKATIDGFAASRHTYRKKSAHL